MDKRIVNCFTLIRRNRRETLFPGRMTKEDKAGHQKWAGDALEPMGFRRLTQEETAAWRSTHPFAVRLSQGGSAVWTEETGLAVIVDGEDGVIFYFASENGPARDAYQKAEDALFAAEGPAWEENIGYLTARPRLAGLAVQRAVVVHLPVLRTLRQMRVLEEEIDRQGCALLPAEEEETNVTALYALVNQRSAAQSEQEMADSVMQAALKAAEKERLLAARMMASPTARLSDEAVRAYGTLRYARRLPAREWRALWSQLRMGAEQGILPIGTDKLDALLMPALCPENGDETKDKQVLRANMVRSFLREEHNAAIWEI